MSDLTVLDVVPGLGGASVVRPASGRRPHEVTGWPAEALLVETVIGDQLVPPITARLANWLTDDESLCRQELGILMPELWRSREMLGDVCLRDERILRELENRSLVRSSQLARFSPSALIESVGRPAAELVVATAVRTATATALEIANPTRRQAEEVVTSPLSEIAQWGRDEMGLTTLGQALDRASQEPVRPGTVADAATALKETRLDAITGEVSERYDLAGALGRLLSCDPAARPVVEKRLFAGASKLTLDALGRELGITRERVRQIEVRAKETMATLLGDPRYAVVLRAAERLRRRLGECIGISELPEEVQWALEMTDPPTVDHAMQARLVLSVAGRYELHEGWLIRGSSSAFVEQSRRVVEEVLSQGPTPQEELHAHLGSLGIPESEQSSWLLGVCRCRHFDGIVVPWTGSMADKAERVLTIRGEPLSPEEIAEALGGELNRRSLMGQIQGDKRFLRRGLKLYGLRSWGGEEYTSIQDEIAEEIERQGGAATLDHLLRTLCEQFGVAEASVRAYATEAPFVQMSDGRVAIGKGDAQVKLVAIEDTRGCFRAGSHWLLRVPVDYDVLRGSGRSVPPGVVQHIGLRPGERRHIVTPTGELLVRYGRQATVGSLRRAALSLDCEEGDVLFVEFTSDKTASFRASYRAQINETDGLARLAQEVGADSSLDPKSAVGHALGLPPDEASFAAIRRRLRARREPEFLPLVPKGKEVATDGDILRDLSG